MVKKRRSEDTRRDTRRRRDSDDNMQVTFSINPLTVLAALVLRGLAVALWNCKKDDGGPGLADKPFQLESLIARDLHRTGRPEYARAEDEARTIFEDASADLRKKKKEKNTVDDIQTNFKQGAKDLRKRENLVAPKQKWHAPPGVQPGTLITPEVGYVLSSVSNVSPDQPAQKSQANYSGLPGSKSFTYAVGRDGQLSFVENLSASDNCFSGSPLPEKQVGRKEKEITNDLGATTHSWDTSYKLDSGVDGEVWNKDRQDWAEQKKKMKEAMTKIVSLFDVLLTTKIVPGARIAQKGKNIQVKNGTKCISLERYYEYVANTLAVQLGDKPPHAMQWAQNSSLQLGLENIEASVPLLKKLLVAPCGDALYTKEADNTLRSLSTGDPVSYTVQWPLDKSLLIQHEMKIKL